MDLKDKGIDVGLATAGLFGALMMLSKTAGLNVGRSVLSIVGGAASANYVTPLILKVSRLEDDVHYSYAIAFLLGFAGLRAIELISSKLITHESTHESPHINKRRR